MTDTTERPSLDELLATPAATTLLESTPPGPDSLLREARAWLAGVMDEGADCPCCGQHARVYRRTLNAGMAHALAVMYRANGLEFMHKPTVLRGVGSSARDESLLRYWGLLEEADQSREDGGRAGWWRVTAMGHDFLHGQIRVHRFAVVYAARLIRLEGEMISMVDALGDRFDLDELLGRTA